MAVRAAPRRLGKGRHEQGFAADEAIKILRSVRKKGSGLRGSSSKKGRRRLQEASALGGGLF
jgi:hypothetical protein